MAVWLARWGWYYRQFFTDNASVNLGIKIMYRMIFIVLLQMTQVIYLGCFRGTGDVLFTILITTFSVTVAFS